MRNLRSLGLAALALAADLGCDPDWGGVIEIPSGSQDGAAVKDLLAKLRLRAFGSSPWRVAIINEADRMTEQAEAVWLDGLEHLPSSVLVIFTTNYPEKLTRRFIRRCEVYEFAGDTPEFREAMEYLVRQTWLRETGENLDRIPEGLGLFDLAEGTYSIGLALQQIAPYARTGEPLPPRLSPSPLLLPYCVPRTVPGPDRGGAACHEDGLRRAESWRRRAGGNATHQVEAISSSQFTGC